MDAAYRVMLWPEEPRMFHDCDCRRRGGICNNAPESTIVGIDWGTCPHSHARHPCAQAGVELARAMDVGAVEGWPTRYSAGVVAAVHAFTALREKKRAELIEATRGR